MGGGGGGGWWGGGEWGGGGGGGEGGGEGGGGGGGGGGGWRGSVVATLSPRGPSVAICQADGVTGEGVVGALCHSPSGRFLAGEGDQGLAAALAAEVIQHEDGV